ncbi:Cytochrome P450 9e2 [Araneus ventricosus]|uniref:Cytochrome P450 9e2 n=1 Tax=Araneus ventricosus TaxID=182803 RepID=A0A4Y2DFA1_ARAVE|nr:Cytochrome P450 9e2 [Araneus ventricosus]
MKRCVHDIKDARYFSQTCSLDGYANNVVLNGIWQKSVMYAEHSIDTSKLLLLDAILSNHLLHCCDETLVNEDPSPPALPWHLGQLKNDRCNNSDTVVGVLTAITGHGPAPPEGGMYRRRFYDAFMMDIILSSAFSTKIDSHNDPNNEFVQHSKRITTSNWNLSIIIYLLFPSLRKLFIFNPTQKVTDFYKDAVLRIIAERKRTGQVRHDFLQLMTETVKEGSDGKISFADIGDQNDITSNYNDQTAGHHVSKNVSEKRLSEEELVAQCVTFFVAGYPTSTSTLSYTSYLLALHPDIQEKLRQEVDRALLKNEGELNYEILHSMKYLDNVVSESLRLSPPVPKLERIVTTEYTLGDTGIVLPKGMSLSVPIAAIHRDPKYFPDPLKFNPDRFKPGERDKHVPYTYLPFGCGPRNCIGAKLALIMVKMCLTYIVANFRINRCPQTKVQLIQNI